MSGDPWLRWLATAAFLAIAGYCVARLAAAHRAPDGYPGRHRAVDLAHVLMGVGMAAMASPVGGPLPQAGWLTVFLLLAVWFAGSWWRTRRIGRSETDDLGWHSGGGLHHAVGALAMLYMLAAMPHAGHDQSPWSAGHLEPGAALPALGWALVAYFLLASVLVIARTDWRTAPRAANIAAPPILRAPRLTATCEATMALGNGFLLLAMLS
ncbi:MAG TPA: DUF5134 domain-containing protein [Actinophytocola sp.]|nr:DUF5134 domain-containing protein [Actinophytocola sp.]